MTANGKSLEVGPPALKAVEAGRCHDKKQFLEKKQMVELLVVVQQKSFEIVTQILVLVNYGEFIINLILS